MAAQEGGQRVGGLSSFMLYFPPKQANHSLTAELDGSGSGQCDSHCSMEDGQSVGGFQCEYWAIIYFYFYFY